MSNQSRRKFYESYPVLGTEVPSMEDVGSSLTSGSLVRARNTTDPARGAAKVYSDMTRTRQTRLVQPPV